MKVVDGGGVDCCLRIVSCWQADNAGMYTAAKREGGYPCLAKAAPSAGVQRAVAEASTGRKQTNTDSCTERSAANVTGSNTTTRSM